MERKEKFWHTFSHSIFLASSIICLVCSLVLFSSILYLKVYQFSPKSTIVLGAELNRNLVPSNTPAPTPFPTAAETTIASPVLNLNIAVVPSPPFDSSSLYLLSKVNAFRQKNGKSEVLSNSKTCQLARERAQEIVTNFSHDGFDRRKSENSFPYELYSEITENIAMNSDYKNVVGGWINSPGHRENMLKDTPFVCIVQNGDYFVYEGWRI